MQGNIFFDGLSVQAVRDGLEKSINEAIESRSRPGLLMSHYGDDIGIRQQMTGNPTK